LRGKTKQDAPSTYPDGASGREDFHGAMTLPMEPLRDRITGPLPPSATRQFSPSLAPSAEKESEGAGEGGVKEDEGETFPPLTDREKEIGTLFFHEKLNTNKIVRELYPDKPGGEGYQKASAEVADAIRRYSEAMRRGSL
ncbi:MAG: hypothetical protein J2P36_27710, partial [Ktedonobacteraceae bacterium]|nr:hypothetical protein [Ktedonobacteraceae bacterium]